MKKKTLKRAVAGGRTKSRGGAEPKEVMETDLKSVLDELTAGGNRKHVNQWMPVQCPYCGEGFDVHIDVTEDDTTMQEDCQICCRPMEVNIHLEDGDVQLNVYRS